MHDYYFLSDNEEDEVIIQAVGNKVSIRVSEEDDPDANAMVYLPVDEIDRMIAGLQAAKRKIAVHNMGAKR